MGPQFSAPLTLLSSILTGYPSPISSFLHSVTSSCPFLVAFSFGNSSSLLCRWCCCCCWCYCRRHRRRRRRCCCRCRCRSRSPWPASAIFRLRQWANNAKQRCGVADRVSFLVARSLVTWTNECRTVQNHSHLSFGVWQVADGGGGSNGSSQVRGLKWKRSRSTGLSELRLLLASFLPLSSKVLLAPPRFLYTQRSFIE